MITIKRLVAYRLMTSLSPERASPIEIWVILERTQPHVGRSEVLWLAKPIQSIKSFNQSNHSIKRWLIASDFRYQYRYTIKILHKINIIDIMFISKLLLYIVLGKYVMRTKWYKIVAIVNLIWVSCYKLIMLSIHF